MKKTHWILLALAALFASLALVATGLAAEKKFTAKLTGKQETPAVKTRAVGSAVVIESKDGKTLHYVVRVKNIKDITAAHIHLAPRGKEGPPVATLFPGPEKTGTFSGILASGIVNASDLSGPMQGKTIADLVAEMEKGGTFVNVHTKAHPNGEIRGQLEPSRKMIHKRSKVHKPGAATAPAQ